MPNATFFMFPVLVAFVMMPLVLPTTASLCYAGNLSERSSTQSDFRKQRIRDTCLSLEISHKAEKDCGIWAQSPGCGSLDNLT